MSPAPTGQRREPGPYEIRIKGHLDARWSTALGGLAITTHPDGTTVLRADVTDQAALHGVLRKLRDLGLPLISVSEVLSDRPQAGTGDHT
jgi:hypothetical protein